VKFGQVFICGASSVVELRTIISDEIHSKFHYRAGPNSTTELRDIEFSFNLGIGMVLITPPENLPAIANLLAGRKRSAYPIPIGEIKKASFPKETKVIFTF